jgi:hypothetical protein
LMIEVDYTLHAAEGGGTDHVEVHSEYVPRVGELVAFGFDRSYQVVDVLWQVNDGKHTSVVVTACERNWHEHIRDVVDAHGRQQDR